MGDCFTHNFGPYQPGGPLACNQPCLCQRAALLDCASKSWKRAVSGILVTDDTLNWLWVVHPHIQIGN